MEGDLVGWDTGHRTAGEGQSFYLWSCGELQMSVRNCSSSVTSPCVWNHTGKVHWHRP